ncbi:MAG TPA: cystathionine gamma-synthase [Planctomycetota bacterium]|nr:cystathionine gamma-synthase [Planctomycetota bacterium]
MRFETKAIHVGQEPEPRTGAVVVPIYQTSTYAQEDVGVHKGHEYSRTSNPTRDALHACLASLEEAKHGLAFASGMGAISTVMTLFQKGDHVVCGDDVYGGTFRVFDKVFSRFGVEFSYVEATDPRAVKAALRPNTRMIWVETPSNPMLKITDLRATAAIAKAHGALLAVDNTFMSPANQRPLTLGADLVVHSTTKYLGGHSDVVGGFVATSRDDLYERIRFSQNAVGATPGPFDCWLTLRGIKTLAVRIAAHERNARLVAEFLRGHPKVESVIWPGLPDHPGHEVQKSQASGFGAIVSLRTKGGLEGARAFCRSTKLFFLAESLGGVESLIEHPAIMTHASVPPENRRKLGITDDFVRLSVGIENPDDLREDLDRALRAT